jgi:hypothetical protein
MNYKINDNKWDVLQAGGLLIARRSQRLRRSGGRNKKFRRRNI